MFDPLSHQEKPILHEWNTLPKPKLNECDAKYEKFKRDRKASKGPPPVTWTVSDIAKAGCLLNCPPLTAKFEDEQEMRRVYTLIYDVFRYKYVLTQALNDIAFFETFPKLSANVAVIWLLFYDLYHRNFNKRETSIAPLAIQLFDSYGFSFPENALWSQKIKLAAAVARLRIKNNALSLSEMLPPHLKDEKVSEQAQNNPVTCWINLHKIKSTDTLCHDIERSFGIRLISDLNKLNAHTFKWDKHCPQTIVFHASLRARLAKSHFVKEHAIIVQDKSFCLGPATFKKLLTDLELTGSVIQTHVNSPRTTAYLATLLFQNEKIKKILAFSAGKRKEEYEIYFNELGMSNIKLFSDRLIDTAPDAHYMEEVVAVFATPPNSYSAVVDPIDLVCSRGGDLSMLEILTETGDSKEARDRIAAVLEEQQKTLRFAMSRPQIQFVLYETHSELDAENTCMVNMTLREINKIAKLHHASLQGKLSAPHPSENLIEDKEVNNNIDKIGDSTVTSSKITLLSESQDDQEKFLETIKIPNSDLFDTSELPSLCDNESCQGSLCPGCYLALIQRKEIIRLNDKYMIQMAEHRGLFGNRTNGMSVKSKPSRVVRKKVEKPEHPGNSQKRFRDSEMERIAAPTQAFLRHTKSTSDLRSCPKNEQNPSQPNVYKRWWKETSRHINGLKRSLIRQKLIQPEQTYSNYSDLKSVVGNFQRNSSTSVDEFIKEKNLTSKIPIYPRLKLKRSRVFERSQVPVTDFEYEELNEDEVNEEQVNDEDVNFECATQTKDKFIRQSIKVYQLSESQSNLVPIKFDVDPPRPITQPATKYSQSPSLHRFSLARLQRGNSKPIPEFEQFAVNKNKKDISIMARPSSRLILSKFSSAHIRQFVSPFYKQLDSPNITGPSVTEIFKTDLKNQSERFHEILSKSKSDCVQTDAKLLKKKIEFPQVDSPVVRYEMPHPYKKVKKIDKIVARLTAPTHSSKAKNSPKKQNLKVTAAEEPPKTTECKHCRIKNMQFEKKDPNYDELQDFLDNIQPLVD